MEFGLNEPPWGNDAKTGVPLPNHPAIKVSPSDYLPNRRLRWMTSRVCPISPRRVASTGRQDGHDGRPVKTTSADWTGRLESWRTKRSSKTRLRLKNFCLIQLHWLPVRWRIQYKLCFDYRIWHHRYVYWMKIRESCSLCYIDAAVAEVAVAVYSQICD